MNKKFLASLIQTLEQQINHITSRTEQIVPQINEVNKELIEQHESLIISLTQKFEEEQQYAAQKINLLQKENNDLVIQMETLKEELEDKNKQLLLLHSILKKYTS